MMNTLYFSETLVSQFEDLVTTSNVSKPTASWLSTDLDFFCTESTMKCLNRDTIRAQLGNNPVESINEVNSTSSAEFLNYLRDKDTVFQVGQPILSSFVKQGTKSLVLGEIVNFSSWSRNRFITLIAKTNMFTLKMEMNEAFKEMLLKKIRKICRGNTTSHFKGPCYLEMTVPWNSIEAVYGGRDTICFKLQHSPSYRCNVIIKDNDDIHSQDIFCPFRDIDCDVNNVIFRNMFISLKDAFGGLKKLIRELDISISENTRIVVEKGKIESLSAFFGANWYKKLFDSVEMETFTTYMLVLQVLKGVISYFEFCEFMDKNLKHQNMEDLGFILKDLALRQEGAYLSRTDFLTKIQHISFKKVPIQDVNLKCFLTPTTVVLTDPSIERGNRVIRQFASSSMDGFRLSLRNDDLVSHRSDGFVIKNFYKYKLIKGISIGNQKFRFFCYSQSQFRNFSCWMFTNPEEILAKCGDFSSIKSIAKYAARIGLCLTTTTRTVKLSSDLIGRLEEVETRDGKYVFSDGVSPISYEIASKIAEHLQLEKVPSAFQGRMMGCKGVWLVVNWPGQKREFEDKIYIRPSQEKFKLEVNESCFFEVCEYTKFSKFSLNKQILFIMYSNQVSEQLLRRKLVEFFETVSDSAYLIRSTKNREFKGIFKYLLKYNISLEISKFSAYLLSEMKAVIFERLKQKLKYDIDQGAVLMGVMDEFGVLEPNECFAAIEDGEREVLGPQGLVAHCPALHPGDIRKVDLVPDTGKYAVFKHYSNVIIFSAKGERPVPNMCGGSDLDGDLYFVLTDPEFVGEFVEEPPSQFEDSSAVKVKSSIQTRDVVDFFIDYTNLNNLGLISDAHLVTSDRANSVKNEASLVLAEKFFAAVDAPKTGQPVKMDKSERVQEYPHYMGSNNSKKTTYHSTSILGKLYDLSVKLIEQAFESNTAEDLEIEEYSLNSFLFEALDFYCDYSTRVSALVKVLGFDDEVSMFVSRSNKKDAKKGDDYETKNTVAKAVEAIVREFRDDFHDPSARYGLPSKLGRFYGESKKNRFSQHFKIESILEDECRVLAQQTEKLGKQYFTVISEQLNKIYSKLGKTPYQRAKNSLMCSKIQSELKANITKRALTIKDRLLKMEESILLGKFSQGEKEFIGSYSTIICPEMLVANILSK